MQRLITSGKWSMRNSGTLYRELPNKGNSSYTYYVQGCPGWKMSLVPVSCPVNHVEICPRGVSLLFKKKGDREARRSLLFPLPLPLTCKGRLVYVRVLNVVLDRAKNVRAIRKSHTWMRGDSRCSIYVTCNWPKGGRKLAAVIWHSWSH